MLLLLTTTKTVPPADLSKLYTSSCRLEVYRTVYTDVTAQREDETSFLVMGRDGKVSLRAPTSDKQQEWLRKCQ